MGRYKARHDKIITATKTVKIQINTKKRTIPQVIKEAAEKLLELAPKLHEIERTHGNPRAFEYLVKASLVKFKVMRKGLLDLQYEISSKGEA